MEDLKKMQENMEQAIDNNDRVEMEDLKKMQDNMEQAIENNDSMSPTTSDKQDETPAQPETYRTRLERLIHSHKFNVSVIVFVVLDCTMVIAVLLFDLEIVELDEEHRFVIKIFHYGSLSILCIFLIEMGLRLFVFRLSFFQHKLEVMDATVVIISFVLDIVFRDSEDASTGTGLLILLRLWRITRIVNGIVLSVKKQTEETLEKEKNIRKICQQNIVKYEMYSNALVQEVDYLQDILKANEIAFKPKERPNLDLTELPKTRENKEKMIVDRREDLVELLETG